MAQTATVQEARRRRALVTGASTGLGAVFATALARQQYDLTIVARSRERLEALAERLRHSDGIAVEVVVADLTQSMALRAVEERAAGDDALALLVNNAGFGTTGPFARLDPDQEEAEIRLNVLALVRLTRAVLPGMVARAAQFRFAGEVPDAKPLRRCNFAPGTGGFGL